MGPKNNSPIFIIVVSILSFIDVLRMFETCLMGSVSRCVEVTLP